MVSRWKHPRFTVQDNFFFFLCLTLANSLARNLLGGSTIPLEDDISGSQPAIHAGHISAISGGHLGKREG